MRLYAVTEAEHPIEVAYMYPYLNARLGSAKSIVFRGQFPCVAQWSDLNNFWGDVAVPWSDKITKLWMCRGKTRKLPDQARQA